VDNILKGKIAERSHPIDGFGIDQDLTDLEPLREILRDVRIVALGEGSHGTSEHFRFKNRVIRFLVEEMGFQTFSIEASLWDCKNIDDYVVMGKGDKHAALASQKFWTWDTHEVMELIDWMRSYNLQCPWGRECHFLGFDMQKIEDICAQISALGELMDRASAGKMVALLGALQKAQRGTPYPELEEQTLWLYGWFQANLEALKRKFGARRTALLEEGARTLVQYILMTQQEDVNETRDRFMAENVARQVESLDPAEKVILWAHNGHIAKKFAWKNLGQRLSERYGSLYYALGFALAGGTFQSRLFNRETGAFGPLQVFEIPPFPETTWENELQGIRPDDFYLDLRSARQDPGIRAWSDGCRPFIMLDEAWDPVHGLEHYAFPMVLSECYDGIVFTHHTSAAVPNETGRRD
jgi:erythromycin esterase